MHFVLYSDIDENSIRDKLGKPEYSYYFVLKAFRPAIEQLGPVTLVRDPATEVDPIYEACAARGERCVFVCFAPPNSVPLGLKCPTVDVIAWEFSTLPDGSWDPDNPRADWRHVLRTLGRAISLSTHTAQVTTAALGADFPIFPIAAPVWDRVVKPGRPRSTGGPLVAERELRIRGTIIDSGTLTLYPEKIFQPGFPPPLEVTSPEPVQVEAQPEPVPAPVAEIVAELRREPEPVAAPEPVIPEPPRHPRSIRYVLAVTKRHALGWYREAIRGLLPRWLRWIIGKIGAGTEKLYRFLTGWQPPGADHGPKEEPHTIRYILAVTKRHSVEWYREAIRELLPRWLRWLISRFGRLMESLYRGLVGKHLVEPPAATAPEPEPAPEPAPPEPEPVIEVQLAPPLPPPKPEVSVRVGGIVYTAVLNPADGRKNWTDIVTAFCWAFRDQADVTLILKMIKGDSGSYRHELFIMLAQLAPFKCRIVTMDGFLEDEDYAGLIESTTYYVNASNAEGLCLPLMEFMALGKPAIAPRHTAMADYIDPSVAFVVESSPEHNVWPNDPRQRFSTMRERIHWDTLVAAFTESYRVATENPARYRAMGARAAEIIRDYSSDAVVREQLRAAFAGIPFPEPAATTDDLLAEAAA